MKGVNKMRVLLVVPPDFSKKRLGKFSTAIQAYLPIGLAYIAAIIEREGYELKVVDALAMRYDFEDVRRIIKDFNPDVIGQQTFYSNLNSCCQVAKIAKEINPKVKVVLGGPYTTIYPDEAIKKKCVDFIIIGEGEVAIKNLLSSFKNGNNYYEVLGIIWKDGDKVVKNSPQPFIEDLDTLPLPARHLFPMERYRASAHLKGLRTTGMMVSRGCPFRCVFCWVPNSFGRKLRYHNSQKAIEEMKILKEHYGADCIRFWDDVFTANKRWVNEFCDLLIKENLNIPWLCLTRVDLVNPELLRKLKAAGCYQIFYGIESGSQRLLDLIQKGITLEKARYAVRITKESGIETFCAYMLALPSETKEEAEQTIKFALGLDSDYVQFNLTVPYWAGPKFHDLALQYGTTLEANKGKSGFFENPTYVPFGRTPEELRKTLKQAYKKFYLRPSYILKRLYKIQELPMKKILILIWTWLKVFFWR